MYADSVCVFYFTVSVSLSVCLSAAVEGMKAVEIDQCKRELKQLKGLITPEQYVPLSLLSFSLSPSFHSLLTAAFAYTYPHRVCDQYPPPSLQLKVPATQVPQEERSPSLPQVHPHS